MTELAYAGIGSRDTPPKALACMGQIAERLASLRWTLRTGGAPGADDAFERAARQVGARVELYLPWPGFNNRYDATAPVVRPSEGAYELARRHHPAFDALPRAARSLLARNGHQILGADLCSPAKLVVCWTPDGAEKGEETSKKTGGTGQAIRIASANGIPVVNLFRCGLDAHDVFRCIEEAIG